MLLTTQYLDEADQLADRITVIDRGRTDRRRHPGRAEGARGWRPDRGHRGAPDADLGAVAAAFAGARHREPEIDPGRAAVTAPGRRSGRRADGRSRATPGRRASRWRTSACAARPSTTCSCGSPAIGPRAPRTPTSSGGGASDEHDCHGQDQGRVLRGRSPTAGRWSAAGCSTTDASRRSSPGSWASRRLGAALRLRVRIGDGRRRRADYKDVRHAGDVRDDDGLRLHEHRLDAVAIDKEKGVTDRFRSMPMAPSAVVSGRGVGDVIGASGRPGGDRPDRLRGRLALRGRRGGDPVRVRRCCCGCGSR